MQFPAFALEPPNKTVSLEKMRVAVMYGIELIRILLEQLPNN
jgi:hypothetical protein